MRELIDLIELRNKMLTQHPYAALSMVSHANSEIFEKANKVRGRVMDVAMQEVITYWK